VPGATRDEVFEIFQIAAEMRVPCYVHLRFFGAIEPGSALEGLQEVLSNAAATGAALHVVHITSTCLRDTSKCLAMIEGARRHGMDVTTEAYPYTAAMTGLETAIFDEGWREKMGISYGDLQWVATGERLTEESFKRYRALGGLTVIHSIPEEISRLAAAHPLVIVASDGVLTAGKGHPRGAGSYARVLGRYVREQRLLSLADAINKMAWLPAQRLEASVPMMRRKGRIKVGADADLVVFDPATVNEQATFDNPAQYSIGIQHVLVNGVFVVRSGQLVESVKPGLAIRR
jgi:N-acyl-D-aspartate/D-glutamate deacylase